MIYRALKPNPALGRNFEALDPLERPQVEPPCRPKRDSLPRGRKIAEGLDRGRGRPVSERTPDQTEEWLARMTDHIPDAGRHRTLFYGHYANRGRGERAEQEPGAL